MFILTYTHFKLIKVTTVQSNLFYVHKTETGTSIFIFLFVHSNLFLNHNLIFFPVNTLYSIQLLEKESQAIILSKLGKYW